MRLQPPDQLSTLLIWIAAIFEALKGGIAAWPKASEAFPFIVDWGWLSFVPLILLTIAVVRQFLDSSSHRPRFLSGGSESHSTSIDMSEMPLARIPRPVVNAPTVQSEGRRYVPANFVDRYLELLRTPHTDLQVHAMLKDHSGERIKLNGFLASIAPIGSTFFVQLTQSQKTTDGIIFVSFDRDWGDHLAKVDFRELINFDAQIVLERNGLAKLAHAELI